MITRIKGGGGGSTGLKRYGREWGSLAGLGSVEGAGGVDGRRRCGGKLGISERW